MKFRGLHTAVVQRDAQGRAARRETIVTSVFAQDIVSDARPIWNLMAYSLSGEPKVAPNVSARAAARAALLGSAN